MLMTTYVSGPTICDPEDLNPAAINSLTPEDPNCDPAFVLFVM